MSKIRSVIMVIEDDALLLEAITRKLKLSGYETVSCAHAKRALEYLKTLPELPDLIWLDYYLPDMDGLEFMDRINENEKWKRIPVMVVSNSASKQKMDAMYALGVKKYLLKAQYRLEDLMGEIKEILGKVGETNNG